MVSIATERSFMITPSVISSISTSGGRPCSARMPPTAAARFAFWKLIGDKLTDTQGISSPARTPLRHLPAGLADRPQADLLDQSALFGQRDELRRRNLAEHRVVPARQRLDAMDGAVAGPDLRLIVQLQRVVGDRAAQRRAVLQPLLGEPVHVGAEEAERGAAGLLGLVHRRIGLLDQRIDVGGVVRIQADADAGGHRHLLGADPQRLRPAHR